jgi:predicted dehydrogenase
VLRLRNKSGFSEKPDLLEQGAAQMQRLRFGIIGTVRGALLAELANPLRAELSVTAVCDLRLARAQSLAATCEATFVCADYEQLLVRDDVDAVFIATPDHWHAAMTLRALEAGKHVLSEIPMAYTLDELERIIALSERTGLKYMLGNECRWLPALEALKRMAHEGYWGEVFYGEAEYLHNLRADGWRTREDDGATHWRFATERPQTTLLGGGPHAFDTLRWLAGEHHFTEAFAYGVGRCVPEHPEPATVVVLLKGVSGAAYKITVSYAMVRPYCLYFSLYGSEGSFEGGRTNQNQMFFQSRKQEADGLQGLDSPYWTHHGYEGIGRHGTSELFMLKEFLAAVREDRPTAIDAREAARSIAPAICALESVRTGKPVAVPVY